jgi:hypothetical protein
MRVMKMKIEMKISKEEEEDEAIVKEFVKTREKVK